MAVILRAEIQQDVPVRWSVVETAWGSMVLTGRGGLVSSLFLPEGDREAAMHRGRWAFGQEAWQDDLLTDVQCQLRAYFAGDAWAGDFTCEVDVSWAGEFQQRVLEACLALGPGESCSYGELARRTGRPGSARAAGRALGANRVPIIIPCHRVVRSDGGLGGYSAEGGTILKGRLLAHEQLLVGGVED